jgi:hypothetical protein
MIRMEFETGEQVVWKGSSAYHIRYPILAVAFFFGLFVIDFGPIGQLIGVLSFILWILFIILSIVSLVVDKRKKYCLTNRRVISVKTSLLVPDLTNVRVAQSRLGRLRGAGNVYFDSKDSRWMVFKHVKDPAQIAQSALSLARLPQAGLLVSSVAIAEREFQPARPNALRVAPTSNQFHKPARSPDRFGSIQRGPVNREFFLLRKRTTEIRISEDRKDGAWNRVAIASAGDARTLQSGPSEYDQRILEITEELCLQLEITTYNPTFISWEILDSRSRRGVEFRYDECLVGKYCLTLSGRMKEVLEPDEWRPIIASSLIFSKVLRRRIVRGFVLSLAACALLALVLFLVLPVLFPQPWTFTEGSASQTGPAGYFVAELASFALVPLGTIMLSTVYARRLRRVADKRAADLVSASAFLSSLNKIAVTERTTVSIENQNVRGLISLLPSLQTRIAALQKSLEPKVKT